MFDYVCWEVWNFWLWTLTSWNPFLRHVNNLWNHCNNVSCKILKYWRTHRIWRTISCFCPLQSFDGDQIERMPTFIFGAELARPNIFKYNHCWCINAYTIGQWGIYYILNILKWSTSNTFCCEKLIEFVSDSVFVKLNQNIDKYWDGNAV